ncbi:MAG: hypothetical protein ACTSW1_18710 [Candidatus Hodarchaeales archaeon]
MSKFFDIMIIIFISIIALNSGNILVTKSACELSSDNSSGPIVAQTSQTNVVDSIASYFVETRSWGDNIVLDFFGYISINAPVSFEVIPIQWDSLINRVTPKNGLLITIYDPNGSYFDSILIEYGSTEPINYSFNASIAGSWKIHFEEDYVDDSAWDSQLAHEWCSFRVGFEGFDYVSYIPDNIHLNHRSIRNNGLFSYSIYLDARDIKTLSELMLMYLGDWDENISPVDKINILIPTDNILYSFDVSSNGRIEEPIDLPRLSYGTIRIDVLEKRDNVYSGVPYNIAIVDITKNTTLPIYLRDSSNKLPNLFNGYYLNCLFREHFKTQTINWEGRSREDGHYKTLNITTDARVGNRGFGLDYHTYFTSTIGATSLLKILNTAIPNDSLELFFSVQFKLLEGETVIRFSFRDVDNNPLRLDYFRSYTKYSYYFKVDDGGPICDVPVASIAMNNWTSYDFDMIDAINRFLFMSDFPYDEYIPVELENIEIFQDTAHGTIDSHILIDNLYVYTIKYDDHVDYTNTKSNVAGDSTESITIPYLTMINSTDGFGLIITIVPIMGTVLIIKNTKRKMKT